MEYRKNLLRRQLYQSDILNIKTGYYKIENIPTITPKPTESNKIVKEFIPNYKQHKNNIRIYRDSLANIDNKSFISNDFSFLKRQNSEIQIMRKYTKTIRENCFDEKGNFSAKKRFRLEFYGKCGGNNIFNTQVNDKKINKSIKEKRKLSFGKIDKSLLNKLDKVDGYQIQRVNDKIKRRIYSCNNIFKNKKNNNENNKDNFKKKYVFTPYKQKEKQEINNNEDNKQRNIKIIPLKLDEKENGIKHSKKKSLNIKTITDKSNNIKNKTQEGNDDFYIEIKNENQENRKSKIFVDKKKLKQIFLKNGLHIYNFDQIGNNILSNNEKFEAKLRKNNDDENFEKNYRNVVKELNKINIKVNRLGLIYENCIFNKNSKIRKGTPGKNLRKNNSKINYGIKRDKYILPQQNKDYKNGYKYNMNYYNHGKI